MAKKRAKPGPQAVDSPAEIAAAHLEFLETGKAGYKAADSALELLIEQSKIDPCPTCGAQRFKNGGIVKGPDGKSFRIVDKFSGKNSIPVGQSARRYQLEEIPSA